VIPAVYDDALTYDALMMKIIYTVNKIIENQYLSVPYLISTSFQATNDSIHVTGSLMQDYEAINLDVELVTTGMDDGQYYINVYNESKAKYVGKDVNQQPPLYISTQFMPMNCTTLYKFQILDGKIVQDSIEYNDLYTHMHNIDPEAHKELFEGVNARITQEINDRIAADTQLQSNIDAETEARKEADNALESSITTERSERIAADTALQNNINAEATARENADTTLQNNIDTEISDRQTAITTEQNARIQADQNLMSKINTEIEDRKRADTTITNNLNQEITSRESDVGGVRDALELHENNKNNPHEVTKTQIGLGNVTNTVGVTKLNNIDGNVNLVAGANVTISNDPTGKNITIGSTGGGGGGSDVTVNGLQGAINIVGSGRASVSTSGQNITINNEPYEGGTGISIVANDINNTGVVSLNNKTGGIVLSNKGGINITNDAGGVIGLENGGVQAINTGSTSTNITGTVSIGSGLGIKTAVSGKTITVTNDGVLGLTANGASNDPLTGYITVTGSSGIHVGQTTDTGGEKILGISNTGPIRRNAVFSMKDASGTATGFTGKAILEFPFSELPYLKGWLYTGTINIPSTIGNNFSLDFAGSNFYFDYAADPTYHLGTPRFFVIDTDCKIIGFFTHSGNNTNKLVFTLKTPGVTGSLLPTCIPIVSS
jgi:multidrug efflux pump subunit AcrA (membrane-fusion protein)